MEQKHWTWTEIMDYLGSLTHDELKSIKPSQFGALSYGQREILKLNIHNRISSNIGVGDRVRHDKYGIGLYKVYHLGRKIVPQLSDTQ